jgi:pimeloyl-ACP methyl ester carboxylesterase
VHDHPDTATFHSDYFSHDGSRQDGKTGDQCLEPFIRHLPPDAIINVVGHSYGGDTAVEATGIRSNISAPISLRLCSQREN